MGSHGTLWQPHAFILFLAILASGCTPTLRLSQENANRFKTVAVMVLASSQIIDDHDESKRRVIVDTVTPHIQEQLARRGFSAQSLNTELDQGRVFKKYPGSFYVDEQAIAKAAKTASQSSALIFYFAYSGDACSLYGWFVDAETGGIVTSSHSLNSFQEYARSNATPAQATNVSDAYASFLISITTNALKGFGT